MRTVTLYATGRCNLRCAHCAVGADQIDPRPDLSTAQVCEILAKLAAAGTTSVTMLGGEVTAFRRDLGPILDAAEDCGIGISINTNLLALGPIRPLLERPALRSIVVSLDGARAATHDAMRGKGSFERTLRNIWEIMKAPRTSSGDLRVEVSFVLSGRNREDASGIVTLAAELGVHRLNAKAVKMIGRARENADDLALTGKDLLTAYCELVITWLACSSLELDLHLPPAASIYVNRRFGLSLPVKSPPACGGPAEFGYVDLLGNLLPCPAMSLEEDPSAGVREQLPAVNVAHTDAAAAMAQPIFVDFERDRLAGRGIPSMWPCADCIFRTTCRPCTAMLIRGHTSDEVEICAAVRRHGDRDVPGITSKLWPAGHRTISGPLSGLSGARARPALPRSESSRVH